MRVAKYEIRDGTECESFFKQKNLLNKRKTKGRQPKIRRKTQVSVPRTIFTFQFP